VHCSVLPDCTVQSEGTNCCSVTVFCCRAVSFSCIYIPVLSRPDKFRLQYYIL